MILESGNVTISMVLFIFLEMHVLFAGKFVTDLFENINGNNGA